MTYRREQVDVICLGIEDTASKADVDMAELEERTWRQVRRQWPPHARVEIEDRHVEWVIFDDPDEAVTFVPSHDCANCREVTGKSKEFLRTHPGAVAALGNIHYTEVWPDADDLGIPTDLNEATRTRIRDVMNMEEHASIDAVMTAMQVTKREPVWTEI